MRGVRSTGLEIEHWHLLSTWIPCQTPRICGFIYTPSTLLLKAPDLMLPLHMAPPPSLYPSGLCSHVGGLPLPLSLSLPTPCFVFLISAPPWDLLSVWPAVYCLSP
jgi:hypothetical protein